MISLVFFVLFCKLALAIPLPAVITRVHIAPATTVTNTYVTGTTTVELPPVQILILNGATYTSTITEGQWATGPFTYTTYFNDVVVPTLAPVVPQTTTSADPIVVSSTEKDIVPAPASKSTPNVVSSAAAPVVSDTTPIVSTPNVVTSATVATNPTPAVVSSAKTTATTPQQVAPVSSSVVVSVVVKSSSAQSPPTSTGSIAAPQVIVYSPYADDMSCKDASTIESDLALIQSKGINKVRLYGTDCLVFDAVLPALSKLGMTANQGVYFNGDINSIDAGVSQIIAYGQANGYGVFDYITVGNEAILNNLFPVSDLIAKISSVKSTLRSNGYNGQVTTAEPPVSYELHPELCTQSDIDFVGINPHSYFDGSGTAEQSGNFIMGQKAIVEDICGGKLVAITETGYPHSGDVNGNQIPSPENQAAAIKSMIEATGGDLTILTTFDDFWKNPGPNNIEQSFGTINLFQ